MGFTIQSLLVISTSCLQKYTCTVHHLCKLLLLHIHVYLYNYLTLRGLKSHICDILSQYEAGFSLGSYKGACWPPITPEYPLIYHFLHCFVPYWKIFLIKIQIIRLPHWSRHLTCGWFKHWRFWRTRCLTRRSCQAWVSLASTYWSTLKWATPLMNN